MRRKDRAARTTTLLHHTRAVLTALLGPPAQRAVVIRLWDGTLDGPLGVERAPRPVLTLRRPGALRRMLLPPSELRLAEAYLRADFDLDGDLEAASALTDQLADRLGSPAVWTRLLPHLLALPTTDLPAARRVDRLRAPPAGADSARPLAARGAARHGAAAVR